MDVIVVPVAVVTAVMKVMNMMIVIVVIDCEIFLLIIGGVIDIRDPSFQTTTTAASVNEVVAGELIVLKWTDAHL